MIIIFLFFFLIYIAFSFFTLKKVFEGYPVYLLYYIVLFLPFYTFFQVLALKLSDQIIFVHLIRYSKDIIVFLSFLIYLFGFRESFNSLKLSFSVLDKYVIFFSLLTLIYSIIPLGDADFFSKVLYSKNIYLISVVYFFGRVSSLNQITWGKVNSIIKVLIISAFLISSIEYFFGSHLHTLIGYSDFLFKVYDRLPVGNFGLSWSFERGPDQGRFAAFFADPLEYSASLILFFTFTLYNFYNAKNLNQKLHYLFFTSVIILSFIYAYSRASIVSAILIFVLSLFLTRKYSILFKFIFLITISTIIFFYFGSDEDIYFVIDTLTFNELSSLGHLFEWIEGFLTLLSNPFGIGLAMSGNASSVDQTIKIGGENQFLIYAVQMGFLSLIAYIMILFYSIKISLDVFLKSKKEIFKSVAFVAGFTKIGLLIPLFTANAELYFFVSLCSWFLVGLAQSEYMKIKINKII